ncbi:MAG: 5-formyltetrahydrofolate cyclo-ligase [Bdellovibrionales bacterium]|nr:5-formyltetrahydrofolate cyclo-ligase [Bdellovibrionales bacterium]
MEKSELRKQLKAKRSAWENDSHRERQVVGRLQNYFEGKSGTWASYRSIHCEPDVSSLSGSCPQIRWVYPKVDGDRLKFYTNKLDQWQINSFGSEEPLEQESEVSLDTLEGFLIPGMAFDRRGYRLGYGKGFYDQTLKGARGTKIGVTYSPFFFDELPNENHDVPMDEVATDLEWVRVVDEN